VKTNLIEREYLTNRCTEWIRNKFPTQRKEVKKGREEAV